ncbi:MAG: DMT family transporter [Deinococcota bacterium]|jgi:drug/metabolite transporter (DMT)-like permease|nr:DMT family transporter [Deinococcota bacterium]
MSPALSVLSLVLVTLIWGTTFAVVKETVATVSVPLLLALRFSLASLLLGWVRPARKTLVPSLVLGLLLFAGFSTQTLGLTLTTASKAAFITGLSVILTPILGALWFRQRIPPRGFVGAALAVAGLGLLTLGDEAGLNAGDLWVLGTAFFYALYIIYLGEVTRQHHPLVLSAMQLWPVTVLCWLWALPELGDVASTKPSALLAIAYLAAFATALSTWLQTLAQRVVPAYAAALIFALEPVFAALFAYLLLAETLSAQGWLGGALVVLAMVAAEFRWRRYRTPEIPPAPLHKGGAREGGGTGD